MVRRRFQKLPPGDSSVRCASIDFGVSLVCVVMDDSSVASTVLVIALVVVMNKEQ